MRRYHQPSVPPQDRGRPRDQHPPLVSAQGGEQPGEQAEVGGGEAGAGHLAGQDRDLVAQHQDLGVLGPIPAPPQHHGASASEPDPNRGAARRTAVRQRFGTR